jgi:hypothetical protein
MGVAGRGRVHLYGPMGPVMKLRDRMRRTLDRWIDALNTDIQGYPHRSTADAIAGDFQRVGDDLRGTIMDTGRIMQDIRDNQAKLDGCKRHRFPTTPVAGQARFRQRYQCEHCAGEVDASAIMNYCAGYAAAGGDPADVWSPYAEYATKFREALQG